ncbi:MAG: hypothetical protein ACI9R3_005471, partial [Verrucomicrobiales bacterium]
PAKESTIDNCSHTNSHKAASQGGEAGTAQM